MFIVANRRTYFFNFIYTNTSLSCFKKFQFYICLNILDSTFLDILLNVFLAIAVDNLGDAEEMDEIEKEKEVSLSFYLHIL